MAYNEKLASKIREEFQALSSATEKEMFGGICFMVDDKMCMGVVKDELMCRIDPAIESALFERPGTRPMDFTGRPMKGYVFVSDDVLRSKKDIQFWVNLCLDFNKRAKSSKKKK